MLRGTITIPADKSISQRALILSTLARGSFTIDNFCMSDDCLSTLQVIKSLGIEAEFIKDRTLKISNKGIKKPEDILQCNNSGTCMRMMSGVLAGQSFQSVLYGDESLLKRPMARIIEPLSLMGAKIQSNNGFAPIKIAGGNLHGINYTSKIASAQVKSSILLSGIQAEGKTIYKEPYKSRNHTEIMLKNMDADILTHDGTIEVKKSNLVPKNIKIVGDFSSAAFFIAAALVVPDSEIILKDVGLNPSRTGFLDIVRKMEADIEILDLKEANGEPSGDLKVKYSNLKGITVEGEVIPNAIDELPLVAILGACAEGITILKDASELRKKESDRICAITSELRKLGIEIEERDDGFRIDGRQKFIGGTEVDSHNDHRIAMSLYIAGLLCSKPIRIKNFKCTSVSFPEFESLIKSLVK